MLQQIRCVTSAHPRQTVTTLGQRPANGVSTATTPRATCGIHRARAFRPHRKRLLFVTAAGALGTSAQSARRGAAAQSMVVQVQVQVTRCCRHHCLVLRVESLCRTSGKPEHRCRDHEALSLPVVADTTGAGVISTMIGVPQLSTTDALRWLMMTANAVAAAAAAGREFGRAAARHLFRRRRCGVFRKETTCAVGVVFRGTSSRIARTCQLLQLQLGPVAVARQQPSGDGQTSSLTTPEIEEDWT